jgi:hypothetical protein
MIAQIATAAAALVFLVLTGLACRAAVRIRHLRKDTEARQATALLLHRLARRPTNGTADVQRLRRIEEALAVGFPDSAVEAARAVASTGSIPVADRLALLRKVAHWQDQDEQAPERTGRAQFDIVVVSHFGLPGGTTSANEAEIRIWHDHGLKVGLLHHPVYDWGPNAPVHPRIQALVDAGAARLIEEEAEVECGLALVRLPIVMMRPLERRPAIRAGRTAVLVNQTPFKYYGETGPREAAWDVAAVARNVEEWLGRPVWYAGGPCVLAALREHHAEETAGLDLAAEPWNEVIAVDDWRLAARREPDGRVRIGRHSRDHELKWPRDPEVLLACHPDPDPRRAARELDRPRVQRPDRAGVPRGDRRLRVLHRRRRARSVRARAARSDGRRGARDHGPAVRPHLRPRGPLLRAERGRRRRGAPRRRPRRVRRPAVGRVGPPRTALLRAGAHGARVALRPFGTAAPAECAVRRSSSCSSRSR